MSPEQMAILKEELIRDEGLRLKPYTDTVGKTTIGVGRNLTDNGISHEEAMILLDNDIETHIALLDSKVPWWRDMSPVRQRVLANMAFNMGNALFSFVNTLSAMERGYYEKAAYGMENSKWAGQVGVRAKRLIKMMEEG